MLSSMIVLIYMACLVLLILSAGKGLGLACADSFWQVVLASSCCCCRMLCTTQSPAGSHVQLISAQLCLQVVLGVACLVQIFVSS